MSKIAYQEWNPSADTRVVLAQADAIATDYAGQGYNLTLRQLFYRFVAQALIANTQRSYKRLGEIVNRGRLAGFLDWRHIEDRTRELRTIDSWDTPQEIMRGARDGYTEDIWSDQETRVEVWVEKDALIDVVARAALEWDVPHFSCRGYVSQSEMWRAAGRMLDRGIAAQSTIVLHLGDHDPSGIDMTRDIADRLNLLSFGAGAVEVRRIALNMDQIELYDPPPNPTKTTDSRSDDYIARYGDDSWELDALEPSVLTELIEEEIGGIVDMDLLDAARDHQEVNRERISKAIEGMDLDEEE